MVRLDLDVGHRELPIAAPHVAELRVQALFSPRRDGLLWKDSVSPEMPPIASEEADVDTESADTISE